MPNAKLAVVITPIAASGAMIAPPADAADGEPGGEPHTPAPTKKLSPTAAQTAAPPKIAWDSPWPM